VSPNPRLSAGFALQDDPAYLVELSGVREAPATRRPRRLIRVIQLAECPRAPTADQCDRPLTAGIHCGHGQPPSVLRPRDVTYWFTLSEADELDPVRRTTVRRHPRQHAAAPRAPLPDNVDALSVT